MKFTQDQAVAQVAEYFKSEHWIGFLEVLKRGTEVRHAHIYLDSCLTPMELGPIIEAYFEKAGLPIQRAIKFLPIKADMLNVYNVTPKGMCHFEFFLRYNEDVVLAPMPAKYSREKKNASYWDDEFMQNYYKQYDFHDITPEAEEQIKAYFAGDDFRYCYRMMIDEYRGLIHSHGLVETSIHPEKLIPYAEAAFKELGVEVFRSVSVIFNSFGKEIPKIVFLLGAPEVSVEVEWHYNPNVAIKAVNPNFFRLADERMLHKYVAERPRLSLSPESIEKVIKSF